MKVCKVCNVEGENFRLRRNVCRDCEAAKERQHRLVNKEEYNRRQQERVASKKQITQLQCVSEPTKFVQKQCKHCSCLLGLEEKRQLRTKTCKPCENKYDRERYRQKAPEIVVKKLAYKQTERGKEVNKKYRSTQAYKEKTNDYNKNKYKHNTNYRLRILVSSRLRKFVKKDYGTLEYLQCSLEIFKSWLESNFDINMNWENMGDYWEIDHIKPCKAFNFENKDELFECFKWSNMRPLSKTDNRAKGAKIDNNLIREYKQNAIIFASSFGHDLIVEP